MNSRGWLLLPGSLQAAGERTEEEKVPEALGRVREALQMGCEFWWVVPSAVAG